MLLVIAKLLCKEHVPLYTGTSVYRSFICCTASPALEISFCGFNLHFHIRGKVDDFFTCLFVVWAFLLIAYLCPLIIIL